MIPIVLARISMLSTGKIFCMRRAVLYIIKIEWAVTWLKYRNNSSTSSRFHATHIAFLYHQLCTVFFP